jgi:hypothetical protein
LLHCYTFYIVTHFTLLHILHCYTYLCYILSVCIKLITSIYFLIKMVLTLDIYKEIILHIKSKKIFKFCTVNTCLLNISTYQDNGMLIYLTSNNYYNLYKLCTQLSIMVIKTNMKGNIKQFYESENIWYKFYNMKNIHKSISVLDHTQCLYFVNNKIEHIPVELCQLTQLQYLSL